MPRLVSYCAILTVTQWETCRCARSSDLAVEEYLKKTMQKWIFPKSKTSFMVVEAQAGNRYNFHVHEYHIKICGLCTILIAADGAGQKLTSDQTLHLKHLQIHKNPWDFMLWRSPQSLDQLWRSLGWSSPVTRPLNVGSYKLQENADCIFYSWKWQVLEDIKKKTQKNTKWNWQLLCCHSYWVKTSRGTGAVQRPHGHRTISSFLWVSIQSQVPK